VQAPARSQRCAVGELESRLTPQQSLRPCARLVQTVVRAGGSGGVVSSAPGQPPRAAGLQALQPGEANSTRGRAHSPASGAPRTRDSTKARCSESEPIAAPSGLQRLPSGKRIAASATAFLCAADAQTWKARGPGGGLGWASAKTGVRGGEGVQRLGDSPASADRGPLRGLPAPTKPSHSGC
jgi:hypothetical protein